MNELQCDKLEIYKAKTFTNSTQHEFESENLWKNVTKALKANDYQLATTEKQKIEDRQRGSIKSMEDQAIKAEGQFFERIDGQWKFKKLNEL